MRIFIFNFLFIFLDEYFIFVRVRFGITVLPNQTIEQNQMNISLLLNCIIFCIGESKRFDRKLIFDDDTTVRFRTFETFLLILISKDEIKHSLIQMLTDMNQSPTTLTLFCIKFNIFKRLGMAVGRFDHLEGFGSS